MRQFTCPKAVTHPSTNRARCRATEWIETNALPLHQTANQSLSAMCCCGNAGSCRGKGGRQHRLRRLHTSASTSLRTSRRTATRRTRRRTPPVSWTTPTPRTPQRRRQRRPAFTVCPMHRTQHHTTCRPLCRLPTISTTLGFGLALFSDHYRSGRIPRRSFS